MRKVLLLAALFLLLAVPARAAEDKIGIVDMQRLISTCDPGQEAMNKLKSQFKGMKDDMDKQKADIDKLRADLEKQGLVMSQEAKLDKEQQ
jgi:outer membrane protein